MSGIQATLVDKIELSGEWNIVISENDPPLTSFTTLSRKRKERKKSAYRQHLALSYVYDSGVPKLYHESETIPWVFSIP